MTANLFLTCFLACMFAFVTFAVFGWQVIGFLIKRALNKHLPEMIAGALHAASGAQHQHSSLVAEGLSGVTGTGGIDELRELMKVAANTPPGIIPHLETVRCGGCKIEQKVPVEVNLEPFLPDLGWKFVPEIGWACRSCAGDK
jgi:hypothetical protein